MSINARQFFLYINADSGPLVLKGTWLGGVTKENTRSVFSLVPSPLMALALTLRPLALPTTGYKVLLIIIIINNGNSPAEVLSGSLAANDFNRAAGFEPYSHGTGTR